jgi:hypothetical protein
MIRQPELKHVPIAVLCCPCCTRKKKPFNSFKSLNIHLVKNHPEYQYKIEIVKNEVYRSGKKMVRGDVIVKTKKVANDILRNN